MRTREEVQTNIMTEVRGKGKMGQPANVARRMFKIGKNTIAGNARFIRKTRITDTG